MNRRLHGYGIHTDLYEQDVEEVDSIRQNAWIGYQRKIVDDLAVSLQFADEYIHVDGKGFSNALLLEPSAYWRFAEWGSIQVKHQIGFINYLLPLLPGPMIDRDGTFHDLGVTVFLDVPKTDLRIRAGYRHRWTFTEGGNGGFFDKDSDTFVIGATHPLPFDITADFSFTRQWDDYNGIGPAAGVGREDRVDFFSILLTRPVIPNVQIYVRYDAVNDESNAGLFDYRQDSIAAGIIWDF
ncbi:MAG: hypothetical protein CMJ49_06115 [Planctomycetaceae bacterium]|nr:hypothetical protein [Planctomycetaceae bacterium]